MTSTNMTSSGMRPTLASTNPTGTKYLNAATTTLKQQGPVTAKTGTALDNVAHCPITLASVTEGIGAFVDTTAKPIASTVGASLINTGYGLVDINAAHIFGALLFVLIFIIVIMALIKLISWTTALLLIIAGFVILYLFGISYRESIRLFMINNTQVLYNNLANLWKTNISPATTNAVHTFLNTGMSSLVPCNATNIGVMPTVPIIPPASMLPSTNTPATVPSTVPNAMPTSTTGTMMPNYPAQGQGTVPPISNRLQGGTVMRPYSGVTQPNCAYNNLC